MRTILPALAAAALALSLAGPARSAHELDGRDLASGEALYAMHCAACHGANLEGQPNWREAGADGVMPAPPHDETGHTWHHDNRLLFDYTKFGGRALMEARGASGFASGMPGFGDTLTDDEIWNVLAFIRSTWPERVQEIQNARNAPHR